MRRKPCQVNVTDSVCGAIEHTSESSVINVYRQFLISANVNADLHQFKQDILRAISRVFGGVSAIIDFEIMGMIYSNTSHTTYILYNNIFFSDLRRFNDLNVCDVLNQCVIVEVSMTVDTTQKMKNGQNMDDSINDGIEILRDDVEKLLKTVIDESATCIMLTRPKTSIAGKAIVTYLAIVTALFLLSFCFRRYSIFVSLCNDMCYYFGGNVFEQARLKTSIFIIIVGVAGLTVEGTGVICRTTRPGPFSLDVPF